MLKRILTYLFVMLIGFQSVVAVGDVHQLHQSGSEHLSFENHQHADEAQKHDHQLDASTVTEGPDCHHCCHCHGQLNPAVLISSSSFAVQKPSSGLPDYSENTPSNIINPLLRPPIALS